MDIPPTIHNSAKKSDVAKTVLMPGDPLRAKFIAETYLEDVRQVNSIRGMLGYTGFYEGKMVTVQGSGMGGPSMSLYSYELYNYYDVDNIIRVGSTGALTADLKINSVIIALSACTDSNLYKQYKLPGIYTPPSAFSLLAKANHRASELNIPIRVCNILSSDMFYYDDPNDMFLWCKLGIMAVDMETASLYLNSARCGKNALSILTVSDNLVSHEQVPPLAREHSFSSMITLALSLLE